MEPKIVDFYASKNLHIKKLIERRPDIPADKIKIAAVEVYNDIQQGMKIKDISLAWTIWERARKMESVSFDDNLKSKTRIRELESKNKEQGEYITGLETDIEHLAKKTGQQTDFIKKLEDNIRDLVTEEIEKLKHIIEFELKNQDQIKHIIQLGNQNREGIQEIYAFEKEHVQEINAMIELKKEIQKLNDEVMKQMAENRELIDKNDILRMTLSGLAEEDTKLRKQLEKPNLGWLLKKLGGYKVFGKEK